MPLPNRTAQTGNTTVIVPKSVRETGDSRHHGGTIEDPLNHFEHHRTMVRIGLRGALKGSRETSASRTVEVNVSRQDNSRAKTGHRKQHGHAPRAARGAC